MNALKDTNSYIAELRKKTDPKLTEFLIKRFAAISQEEYQRFLDEGKWQINICQISSKETGKPFYIENEEVFIFTGKDIQELENNFMQALAHLGKHWVFKRPLSEASNLIMVDFKTGEKVPVRKWLFG